ncbi:TetR/AcrR family transcriptional regulator [Yimella sp. cx-51]|uniref:TetR/AcrR family transcriptional regulator n=1 Tax=Yimella sp. cx-51 TaxID=2770551 RepID=UPI00165DA621|nr:TetR/AcrR family transcriptional regulator [Yimella sp. cx-51]MBC9958077.1 TetR/AcrR family transcriptional regulator [Yimella sp. cx-51]QTH38877.1 TetR family transcriptional regulator [Yimella sp. cx-51]
MINRPGRAAAEARIHSAALTLFARKGFQGTGIRDIAAEAGISLATLYHYMGTKDDLLVEMMLRSLTRLIADAETVCEEGVSPLDRIGGLTLMHVLAHGTRREETLVVDSELRSLDDERLAPVLELRDRYESIWAAQLADAVEQGNAVIPEASVTRFAILGMSTDVAVWFRPGGQLDLPEIALHYAELTLRMIGARKGRRSIHLDDCELPPIEWFVELVQATTSATPGAIAQVGDVR